MENFIIIFSVRNQPLYQYIVCISVLVAYREIQAFYKSCIEIFSILLYSIALVYSRKKLTYALYLLNTHIRARKIYG